MKFPSLLTDIFSFEFYPLTIKVLYDLPETTVPEDNCYIKQKG